MKHIPQIIHTLKIKNSLSIGTWKYLAKKKSEQESEYGAQIDLLIDRNDNAMHICEIKYTQTPFVIDKQYAKILQNKMHIFKEKKQKNNFFFP